MERIFDFDVAVAGGGPAGVAAALGAHECGCRTLLLERAGFLGGEFAASNVPSYCGFFDRTPQANLMAGGVGRRVLRELESIGVYNGPRQTPGGNWCVPVEPEAIKYVMDRLVEAGPTVFLHAMVLKAEKDGDRITSLLCADDEGMFTVRAAVFVDATGDGNLAWAADAKVQFGDEQGNVQTATRVMEIAGIDPQAVISGDACEKAVEKAERDGMGPFSRRKGSIFRWLNPELGFASFPSVKRLAFDAETWTACEQETRRQCWEYLKAFRKYIPGMEHAYLVSTGSVMGVREGRRIIGVECMRGKDVRDAKKRPDTIGRGCWPVEIHTQIDRPAPFEPLKGNGYYDIPLGILKSVNVENLWAAGRAVSADHEAFASLRVGGTAFVTGQAAGVAAACSLTGQKELLLRVQENLRRQGALL